MRHPAAWSYKETQIYRLPEGECYHGMYYLSVSLYIQFSCTVHSHGATVTRTPARRCAGLTRQHCPWTLVPLAHWDACAERSAAIWLARRVARPLMRLRDSDYCANSLQVLAHTGIPPAPYAHSECMNCWALWPSGWPGRWAAR